MNNALQRIDNEVNNIIDQYGYQSLRGLLEVLSRHIKFGKYGRKVYLCLKEGDILFSSGVDVKLLTLEFEEEEEPEQPEQQQQQQQQQEEQQQRQVSQEWTYIVNKYRNNHEKLIQSRINRLMSPNNTTLLVLRNYLLEIHSFYELSPKISLIFSLLSMKERDLSFYRHLLCWYFYSIDDTLFGGDWDVKKRCSFLIKNQLMESTTDYAERILIGKKSQIILDVLGSIGLLSTELIIEKRFCSTENILRLYLNFLKENQMISKIRLDKEVDDLFTAIPNKFMTLF